jgi:hypothetical protein
MVVVIDHVYARAVALSSPRGCDRICVDLFIVPFLKSQDLQLVSSKKACLPRGGES